MFGFQYSDGSLGWNNFSSKIEFLGKVRPSNSIYASGLNFSFPTFLKVTPNHPDDFWTKKSFLFPLLLDHFCEQALQGSLSSCNCFFPPVVYGSGQWRVSGGGAPTNSRQSRHRSNGHPYPSSLTPCQGWPLAKTQPTKEQLEDFHRYRFFFLFQILA